MVGLPAKEEALPAKKRMLGLTIHPHTGWVGKSPIRSPVWPYLFSSCSVSPYLRPYLRPSSPSRASCHVRNSILRVFASLPRRQTLCLSH